jgi:hypothetical protein
MRLPPLRLSPQKKTFTISYHRRRLGNDALSIFFADASLASAFVARWCVGAKVERRRVPGARG